MAKVYKTPPAVSAATVRSKAVILLLLFIVSLIQIVGLIKFLVSFPAFLSSQ